MNNPVTYPTCARCGVADDGVIADRGVHFDRHACEISALQRQSATQRELLLECVPSVQWCAYEPLLSEAPLRDLLRRIKLAVGEE